MSVKFPIAYDLVDWALVGASGFVDVPVKSD